MSNPQGPGKQGRKDAKAKASQPQQAGAPGRSEHQQSARPTHEQGHMQHRPGSASHPSSSHSTQSREREEALDEE